MEMSVIPQLDAVEESVESFINRVVELWEVFVSMYLNVSGWKSPHRSALGGQEVSDIRYVSLTVPSTDILRESPHPGIKNIILKIP